LFSDTDNDEDDNDDSTNTDTDTDTTETSDGTYHPCQDCFWFQNNQTQAMGELVTTLNDATIDPGGSIAIIDLSGTSSGASEMIWNNDKFREQIERIQFIGGYGKGKGTYHPSIFGPGRLVVGKNFRESSHYKTKKPSKIKPRIKVLCQQ
jgi:hypothetical protein